MMAMKTVKKSSRDEIPNWTVTAAISPSAEALTPSSRLPAQAELRILGMSGFEMATKTKEGRKIPRVASRAPGIPPSRYPMKVAAVKRGPGVTCPMATWSTWAASTTR